MSSSLILFLFYVSIPKQLTMTPKKVKPLTGDTKPTLSCKRFAICNCDLRFFVSLLFQRKCSHVWDLRLRFATASFDYDFLHPCHKKSHAAAISNGSLSYSSRSSDIYLSFHFVYIGIFGIKIFRI